MQCACHRRNRRHNATEPSSSGCHPKGTEIAPRDSQALRALSFLAALRATAGATSGAARKETASQTPPQGTGATTPHVSWSAGLTSMPRDAGGEPRPAHTTNPSRVVEPSQPCSSGEGGPSGGIPRLSAHHIKVVLASRLLCTISRRQSSSEARAPRVNVGSRFALPQQSTT